MPFEIERKFLVNASIDDLKRDSVKNNDAWFNGTRIEQCYLPNTGDWAIRVRKEANYSFGFQLDENNNLVPREDWDRHAFYTLTMKRQDNGSSITRHELEHGIMYNIYNDYRDQCGHEPLGKYRWTFPMAPRFTVDEFLNPVFNGLILAEIELQSEDEIFDKPDWLGDEVTDIGDYTNQRMADKLRK